MDDKYSRNEVGIVINNFLKEKVWRNVERSKKVFRELSLGFVDG